MNNVANSYDSLGQYAEAIALYEKTVALQKAKLGVDHPDTLLSMLGLSTSYSNADRHAEAIELDEKILALETTKLGPDHQDTLGTMNILAWELATIPIDRLRDGKRALELATKVCEVTNYKDPNSLETLAAAYAETGDFDAAVKWCQRSLELLGDNKDAQMRKELSRALETYKAKKPIRQGGTSVE
jgi:tetratricopeptide (TPR) repeat protein